MNEDVRRRLDSCPPAVAELAGALCSLVGEVLPDAVITVEGNDIGFGTGPGYRGLVFTVSPHSRHVNLGIAGGAGLPDPAGLMEGTGKVHRHVKIHDPAQLDQPALRELLATAVRQRQRPS